MSNAVAKCPKCGNPIEKADNSDLFRILIKTPKKKDSFFNGNWEYHNVILCEDCQNDLWRWIYCEDGESFAEA